MQIRQSSVTHELITPIRCIIQFSKELTSNLKRDSKRYKMAWVIYTSAKLIYSQVNNLLDKNLLDKNLFSPSYCLTNPIHLIKSTFGILEAQAKLMEIKLEYRGPSEVLKMVTDKQRVL